MLSDLSETPRRFTFLPGFIPGSLYVVILERVIPFVSPPGSSASGDASSLEYLGLFYQEKPTVYPSSADIVLSGQYWGLLAPNHTTVTHPSGGFTPVKLSIPIAQALGGPPGEISMADVLGYVRIAERVDLRALELYMERYGAKVDPEMTSETYVFNALSGLRRARVLQSTYWFREAFDAEIAYFRHLWGTEKAARAESRRKALEKLQKKGRVPLEWAPLPEKPRSKEFAEVWWGDFSMQEHDRRR